MYVPKLFKPPDIDTVKQFVHKNSFATLVGMSDQSPIASHIPLILNIEKNALFGHLAKGNALNNILGKKGKVLAIFMNAHAYVSSSWYSQTNVPTWNYIAVHVYGESEIIDSKELYDSLESLVDKYEKNRPEGYRISDMTPDMLSAHMKGITGFKINITKIEAAYKLSQNRNDKDYQAIIDRLESSSDQLENQIATEMKKLQL